jgi:hypothetical protein
MAKLKSKSTARKAQFTAYKAESRCSKNRKARLERHMKKHPNDKQTEQNIDSGTRPHRKSPGPNSRRDEEQYGVVQVGTKKAKNPSGGMTEYPAYKLVLPVRAPGYISNALKQKNQVFKITV